MNHAGRGGRAWLAPAAHVITSTPISFDFRFRQRPPTRHAARCRQFPTRLISTASQAGYILPLQVSRYVLTSTLYLCLPLSTWLYSSRLDRVSRDLSVTRHPPEVDTAETRKTATRKSYTYTNIHCPYELPIKRVHKYRFNDHFYVNLQGCPSPLIFFLRLFPTCAAQMKTFSPALPALQASARCGLLLKMFSCSQRGSCVGHT